MNKTINKTTLSIVLFTFIVSLSFLVRVYDLDYNSPFNDEAIYVVVGRTGLFLKDWISYDADSWMAGSQYLFPVLSALAYRIGGITAARGVNVFFGLSTALLIYLIVRVLSRESRIKYIQELLALSLIGLVPIGVYVSRLATYDAPSFFFLFLSFYFIVKNRESAANKKNIARNYLMAALSMFFAFAFKIVAGIYLPFIFIFSYLDSGRNNSFRFWKIYFLIPFVVTIGAYIALNISNFYDYYTTQPVLEYFKLGEVLKRIWEQIYLIVPFWILGSIGMIAAKKLRDYAILSFGVFSQIAFHLVFKNAPSLDKHTFIAIGFMVIIASLGIGNLIDRVGKKSVKSFIVGNMAGIVVFYWLLSVRIIPKYNTLWRNTFKVQNYVSSNIKNGHRILAESGASIILAASDNDFPTNVSTFDWFEYEKLTDDDAYVKAVKDGYFDYIQLEERIYPKLERNSKLSSLVSTNFDGNYQLVYKEDGFLVYKRNF